MAPRPRHVFPLGFRSPAVRPFQAGFAAVLSACTSLIAIAGLAYAAGHTLDALDSPDTWLRERVFVHTLAPFFAIPAALGLALLFLALVLARSAGVLAIAGVLPIAVAVGLHAGGDMMAWANVFGSITFLFPYAALTWLFFWAIVRETLPNTHTSP